MIESARARAVAFVVVSTLRRIVDAWALTSSVGEGRARVGMPTPPSLVELSFETLLANVASLSGEALASLPEHLQISLFRGVLAKGKLDEHILVAFHRAARDNGPRAENREPEPQTAPTATSERAPAVVGRYPIVVLEPRSSVVPLAR